MKASCLLSRMLFADRMNLLWIFRSCTNDSIPKRVRSEAPKGLSEAFPIATQSAQKSIARRDSRPLSPSSGAMRLKYLPVVSEIWRFSLFSHFTKPGRCS